MLVVRETRAAWLLSNFPSLCHISIGLFLGRYDVLYCFIIRASRSRSAPIRNVAEFYYTRKSNEAAARHARGQFHENGRTPNAQPAKDTAMRYFQQRDAPGPTGGAPFERATGRRDQGAIAGRPRTNTRRWRLLFRPSVWKSTH